MKTAIFALLVAGASAFAPARPSFVARSSALFSKADKVTEIIVEQLGVDAADVVPDAKFIEDLGADSLDTVELIMAIEEEFDCEIPEDDAANISTVQEVISYVDSL